MSGSFNAGVTALEMGVPLFVLSRGMLDMRAAGNKVLFRKGGIELPSEPKMAVKIIMKYARLRESTRDERKQFAPHSTKEI